MTDADETDPLDDPPETALGVEDLLDDDVPAAGGHAPDDLRARMRREEPDVARPGDPDLGTVPPGGITDQGEPGEPDWDVIDPGGARTDTAADPDRWPAEEAAMHIVDGSG
jgi:hypothetical protein